MNIIDNMITERQEALLASIIEEFIKTAEPISSKFLEKSGFFDLSSATIRAEMSELEVLGYLAHLHTSGGRVPTDYAYRFYVDNLASEKLKVKSEKQEEKIIREAIWGAGDDPREINKVVAQTLSALSDNLIITGIIEEDDFFKVGLSSLFEMPEFREFDRVSRLASFFDAFEELVGQIEGDFFDSSMSKTRSMPDNKVRVFIGQENPIRDIRDETVMFAKYNLPDDLTGSLTLVGPTRMNYAKNIGLIKYATQELNKISKQV
ncbi:MAG: hypothetical protein AAB784_02345 [Patescibacteria group bacterium]